jgi:hypothetical protein
MIGMHFTDLDFSIHFCWRVQHIKWEKYLLDLAPGNGIGIVKNGKLLITSVLQSRTSICFLLQIMIYLAPIRNIGPNTTSLLFRLSRMSSTLKICLNSYK